MSKKNAPNDDSIAQLKKLIENLKQELDKASSERDQVFIEAQLNAVDTEAAKSFDKLHYTSTLRGLFEESNTTLKKYNTVFIFLSILTLLCLAGSVWVLSDRNERNYNLENKIDSLTDNVDHLSFKLSSSAKTIDNIITTNHQNRSALHTLISDQKNNTSTENQTLDNQKFLAGQANQRIDSNNSPRNTLIQQQKERILSDITSARLNKGFPKNYQKNKTDLAQLYLIVMQNSSDEPTYYEAHLAAINELEIDASIKPNTIDELAQFDKDFLQASYSAHLITLNKRARQWRYRDADRQFSTYYNNNNGYDLGEWQIVNQTQDYSALPEKFLLNIERITKHILFNNKNHLLATPKEIFYLSYTESAKNGAVSNLLGGANIEQKNNVLIIDTLTLEIRIHPSMVTTIQNVLANEDLMDKNTINGLLGPKTRTALLQYRRDKGLRLDRMVDINLLQAMNIPANVTHLIPIK